jgi:SNF2 family DNA or RNA helicase
VMLSNVEQRAATTTTPTGSLTLRDAMTRYCGAKGKYPLKVTYSDSAADTSNSFVWEPPRSVGQRDARRHYKALHSECVRVPGQWALTEEAVEKCRRHPLTENKRLLQHLMQHTLRLDLPSSKEQAALRYIAWVASRGDKIIVYSNYVAALQSLNRWLHQADHRTVLVTGQTGTQEQNDSLLQEFECQPDIRALLMTLKLGAEGLNIECANHVLFLDLWWNPFASDQGEQRVQRAGQRKDVFITYLVMQDSIEQHMLRVAARKRALLVSLLDDADDAGSDVASEEEESELSQEDVLQLFDYNVTIETMST